MTNSVGIQSKGNLLTPSGRAAITKTRIFEAAKGKSGKPKTEEEISQMLVERGIPYETVESIMDFRRDYRFSDLVMIADILGVSTAHLVGCLSL